MRTLFVTELFPPRVGGTARWFHEIYKRFSAGDMFILTDHQQGDPNDDEFVIRKSLHMTDWGFVRPRSAWQYLNYVRIARKLVREKGIRILCCGRVVPEGVIGYAIWKIWRVPYCVFSHGEEIGTAMSSGQLRFLMNQVYYSAKWIIANSQNTRMLLLRMGIPASKIAVISPGVDVCRFSPGDQDQSRKLLGLDGHTILLSVGRLQRRKGHDMVIRALPRIERLVSNIKYVIVGNGEEKSRLYQIAQEHNAAHLVIFAGELADELLPEYYRACDIFVMANREEANQDIEGFGIVFLEASACGKPIVAGRSGGTSDAVVDGVTGILVQGENSREIADAIISLVHNRDRACSMGQMGRQRVEQDFSWDKVVNTFKQLEWK
jgi:phosphatidyl-myo-inositol dimannoside synthase